MGLVNPGAPQRGWLQRFCSHSNSQDTGYQQLALSKTEGSQFGLQNDQWGKSEGGAPRKPGVSVEHFGGVVGLFMKHPLDEREEVITPTYVNIYVI